MSEAVRTIASPAGTWAIVVTATILALFMATVTTFVDLRVARAQRTERMLGIAPEAGDAWAMEAGSEWPRFSQALLAAAGVPQSQAAQIRSGPPTADAAGRHDIPAQRDASAEQLAAAYAEQPEADSPTEPIPAARAQGSQGSQYASGGRHERAGEGSPAETTRPDLLAQESPGRHAMPMPRQRTGESDRAERRFAGPAPQDDEDEHEDEQ